MPLSEHEQHILDEIEKRLAEEDPRTADAFKRPFTSHLTRRLRVGVLTFIIGFVLLLLFPVSGWGQWAALVGFGVMLASALVVYRSLKQLGTEQLRSLGEGGAGRFSVAGSLARWTERFRKGRGGHPSGN